MMRLPSFVKSPGRDTSAEVILVRASVSELARPERTEYIRWLDRDEKARLERLVNAEMADCFLTGRAIVKQFVASVWGCTPPEVRLVLSAQGKPALLPALDAAKQPLPMIQFSVSHKFSAMAVAFAQVSVGVDLEARTALDKMKVAKRFFHASEVETLQALSDEQRKDCFARFWALKEAEVKRQGGTLARLLGHAVFSLDGKQIHGQGVLADNRYLLFQPPEGYVAIARTGKMACSVHSYRGLPLTGYTQDDLALVAVSD